MEGKFDRRIKPQREREIYRPGSGPLKRTDPADSKGFVYKYDYAGRSDNSRIGKDDYATDQRPHESNSYNRYEPHDKSLDKDRKKTRKPDASIYVPKQRSRPDGTIFNESHNFNSTSQPPLDNQKPPYSSRDGLNRENEPSNNSQYDSYHQSRVYDNKQFTRGYKNDNQSNWKDYSKENSDHRKFDSRDYDSQNQSAKPGFKNNPPYEERNTYYNSEHKGSNNYRYGNEQSNEKYRSDRGSNDNNRMGRSLSRRNSSNSISLPDAYSSWPPRLQRQYLESHGIKLQDAEKYLKSKQQQQQQFSNSNRDNRFSQTLPPKNNRNSHFKINNKENPPRNNRFFPKSKPFDERPGTDHSGSSEEKSKPSNAGSSEFTNSTEKSWNSSESAQEPIETKSDSGKKNNQEDEPSEEDTKNDIKEIVENSDEDFVSKFHLKSIFFPYFGANIVFHCRTGPKK